MQCLFVTHLPKRNVVVVWFVSSVHHIGMNTPTPMEKPNTTPGTCCTLDAPICEYKILEQVLCSEGTLVPYAVNVGRLPIRWMTHRLIFILMQDF